MAGNRRSTILLYSADGGIADHQVRLVLAEKGLESSVEWVPAGDELPSEAREVSPNGELPVMLDRELGLHGVRVIVDYVDERYPHPPFMPMDPVSRARTRLALHRIEQDWYARLPADGWAAAPAAGSVADLPAGGRTGKPAEGLSGGRASGHGDGPSGRDGAVRGPHERPGKSSGESLGESLAAANEVFAAMPFFLGRSYSVLDAALAPLLWRLPHYGIVLPETAPAVAGYARRMFARPAFRASLGPREKEMAP